MKKKTMCIIIISSIIVSLASIMLYKYAVAHQNINNETYRLYLSNTNFPVVFEDGNYSRDLKKFVIKDLNAWLKDAPVKEKVKHREKKFNIESTLVSSQILLEFLDSFLPSYVNSTFLRKFGYLYTKENKQYIIISNELMELYNDLYINYKKQPEMYDDLNNFCYNILPNLNKMDKKEINRYVKYIKTDDVTFTLDDITWKKTKRVVNEISIIYASSVYNYSYLSVYDLQVDDEGHLYPNISYIIQLYLGDSSAREYLKNEILVLGYENEQWKLLFVDI